MNFSVISLFPESFGFLLNCGVISRAIKNKIISFDFLNLRDFATDKHKTVDDRPYGGESGMLLKPDVLSLAILAAKSKSKDALVVYLSPQGKPFKQDSVSFLQQQKSIIFICGRYEGIDERIIQKYVDLQISIGDYVLSGGELPAMVVIDAVARAVPGVLGKESSYNSDSFAKGLLKGPQYTRPRVFEGMSVPDILLSGNHDNIKNWRKTKSFETTMLNRPDLLKHEHISDFDKTTTVINKIRNK